MRSLVAGILVGWLIAAIWAGLNRPQPTPPPRKGKIIDVYATGEFERVAGL